MSRYRYSVVGAMVLAVVASGALAAAVVPLTVIVLGAVTLLVAVAVAAEVTR